MDVCPIISPNAPACALRRRLGYLLGEHLVPREFRCTICLAQHAARHGLPATSGSSWDREVFGPSWTLSDLRPAHR
jgi:hypothetical protein